MDDEEIRSVNRRCFSKDMATDVISLTYQPVPGGHSQVAAEIFVNAELALKRARGDSRRAARELALYVAHGLDHLCGGRDETPAARAAMLRRENRWLREAEQIGLLQKVAPPDERARELRTRRKK